MVINIQQYEYVTQSGTTAGIVVLPLNQNIMPFPEDHGLLVGPGYETSIGLTRVRMLYQF
jgi:Amiloride-sensitive sodium channel